jgi:uncharacterized iron-regulated membrane protein
MMMDDASRPGLRALWFQFHKWIGISLAIVLIPLSLTGSLLVWHDQLDEWLHPSHFAQSGPAQLPASHYVDAALDQLPEEAVVSSLVLPAGKPVQVIAVTPSDRPGLPKRTAVWLDPVTARVIDVAPPMQGIIRWSHDFHGSLMAPGIGRAIVGWLGVAMLISALTGLWLWWPVTGGWTRGLRWRRQRNFDANLHHQIGFWTSLPLAILALTGIFISFPWLLGSTGGPGGAGGARARSAPLADTHLTVDQAVAAALSAGKGAPRMITWPTERQPVWRVGFGGEGARAISVSVDDDSGVASAAKPEQRRGGPNGLARRIHGGEGLSFIWQLIIFLAGLMPAVLGTTGILMWLRIRRPRAKAAAREAVSTIA